MWQAYMHLHYHHGSGLTGRLLHARNMYPSPTYLILVSRVIREQWIRAKYERKEFLAEATDDDRAYTTGQT